MVAARCRLPDGEHPDKTGSGFLALWVERSERRPHRSEAKDDKRYYKRAGDSSFVMEHYDIEDAFNRVGVPDLQLFVARTTNEDRGFDGVRHTYRIGLHFSLQNNGSLSACAPFVRIDNFVGGEISQAAPLLLKRRTLGGQTVYQGDAAVFVHPGLEVDAFYLAFDVCYYWGTQTWHFGEQSTKPPKLVLDCSLGCQNAKIRTMRFDWSGFELGQLVQDLKPQLEPRGQRPRR
ncbi:MAG: hypothetical protein GEV13_33340 [Rhodospirillales bacterium]|nr:hypothetical protein [Rhodospirillales bacterium]